MQEVNARTVRTHTSQKPDAHLGQSLGRATRPIRRVRVVGLPSTSARSRLWT